MTDADNAEDLAPFSNSPTQAKSLLHNLVQTARNTYSNMNTNKTEFVCFQLDDSIFTLSSKLQKIVDQLTYLSSNITSTESNVIIYIRKAWTFFVKLLIIRKSDFSDHI